MQLIGTGKNTQHKPETRNQFQWHKAEGSTTANQFGLPRAKAERSIVCEGDVLRGRSAPAWHEKIFSADLAENENDRAN
jgi:hypothetical protein